MIEIVPTEAEHIIGLRLSGKFEITDFEMVAGIIEEKLKEHEKLRLYAEIESIKGISLKAFVKDFAFSLRHYRDFEKEAIVSDKGWLEKLAAIGDRILPSIEVKHFSFEDKEEALHWIKN